MEIVKIIRSIQVMAVLVILLGSVCGFLNEVYTMVMAKKVELADLLLLFIYVEVMGMIRVYLLNEEIRITYPLIIAITAISRLIILQKKDLDPAILVYESCYFNYCISNNSSEIKIFEYVKTKKKF